MASLAFVAVHSGSLGKRLFETDLSGSNMNVFTALEGTHFYVFVLYFPGFVTCKLQTYFC